MRYLVGIDDSDSRFGLCTTYLGYRIVLSLLKDRCAVTAYPRLVRLNPNIPFKTRGNAAICIEFESDDPAVDLFEAICSLVERYSDVENGANTGVVLIVGAPSSIPYFARVYHRALSGVVNKEGVLRTLSTVDARVFTLGNGMGVVGASAALGFDPLKDHTFELLAYRRPESCGKPREVDEESVKLMDRATFPRTYNNYDYESGRVMITPHGADPVFLGIRGESPQILLRAFSSVHLSEEIAGHIVYVTNQHTDAHLHHPLGFPLKAFSSGWLEGRVIGEVETGSGSHVYFGLRVGESETVKCAVYEPTGDLRRTARLLKPGDSVRVAGGVRRSSAKHPSLVNVERIEVLSLEKLIARWNPACPRCGSRMKSEGRSKGFQCRKCKTRTTVGRRRRVSREIERTLRVGAYLASTRSQRHLTKQLIRYGRELEDESAPLVEGWIGPALLRPFPAPARSP